jgi:hypothetical protein
MLAGIFSWLPKDFDTRDLIDAKVLLYQLGRQEKFP